MSCEIFLLAYGKKMTVAEFDQYTRAAQCFQPPNLGRESRYWEVLSEVARRYEEVTRRKWVNSKTTKAGRNILSGRREAIGKFSIADYQEYYRAANRALLSKSLCSAGFTPVRPM